MRQYLFTSFFSRKQQDSEPFDKFYIDLKTLIGPCQFDAQESKILRTQIILGIKSDQTKERLLREDVSLEKVVQFCRTVEQTEINMKVITENQNVSSISKKMYSSNGYQQGPNKVKGGITSQSSDRGIFNSNNCSPCYRCGRSHENRACPAFNRNVQNVTK